MARRAPDFGGRFRQSVAVVTGASAGLGRQIALDLARAGAVVIAVARREELLEKMRTELESLSPSSTVRCCDVADTPAWTALLAEVDSEYGRIDILINNAALDPGIRLVDITVEDFQRVYAVNFFAPVAGTLAVLPGMFTRGQGIIANVSSDAGRFPPPGPGAYPSSKSALGGFTESVSYRAAKRGIRLHILFPAWMPTDMGMGGVKRGLRTPPRIMRRSEAQVSRLLISRLGTDDLEISASRIISAATVLRAVAPKLYRRWRKHW